MPFLEPNGSAEMPPRAPSQVSSFDLLLDIVDVLQCRGIWKWRRARCFCQGTSLTSSPPQIQESKPFSKSKQKENGKTIKRYEKVVSKSFPRSCLGTNEQNPQCPSEFENLPVHEKSRFSRSCLRGQRGCFGTSAQVKASECQLRFDFTTPSAFQSQKPLFFDFFHIISIFACLCAKILHSEGHACLHNPTTDIETLKSKAVCKIAAENLLWPKQFLTSTPAVMSSCPAGNFGFRQSPFRSCFLSHKIL